MPSVTPLFAQWLTGDALWASRVSAAMTARWGERAVLAERATGIALLADAQDEADRLLAFFAEGPFAVDEHQVVMGDGWAGQLARVVTLTIDKLGYGDGVDVFVLEATDDRATGLSTIAVLCPLPETAGWA